MLNERSQALRCGEIELLKVVATVWMIERAFPTFLHQYAEHVPGVKVVLVEAPAGDHVRMLESGEVHFAVTTIHAREPYDDRFGCYWLPRFHLLAACIPSLQGAHANAIDIRQVVKHPLLLPKPGFATRSIFDAVCRSAGVAPNVFFESSSPHAMLALVEAGHGTAIVPSLLQTDRGGLQFSCVTHRQEPLRITPAVLWDRTAHAEAVCRTVC